MAATTARNRMSATVAIGYAADAAGNGIVHAALSDGRAASAMRVPFRVRPLAACDGAEVGFAAIAAVAAALKARGFARVRIRIADETTAAFVAGRLPVPPALAMPYVKVRCALHAFAAHRVEHAERVETDDLEARARADARLRLAA